MSSGRLMGRIAIFAGGAAIVAMGALTSCSSGTEKEAPTTPSTPTSSTPTSSAPAPTPTEKAIGPDYEGSFTPSINPAPPGSVCKQIQNGVCIR